MVATISRIIPEGTFFAEEDLTVEQVRAIQLVEKLGEKLVKHKPGIADFYRKNPDITYIEIARRFIPYKAENFPGIAENAVGYALRRLIPKDEMRKLTRNRRASQIESLFDGFDSEKFREHCRKASARRHELHGVDTKAMTHGRGIIPWSDEERAYVLERFNFKKRNYAEVADMTTAKFGNNRNAKNVYDMIRYEPRRKK